MDIEIRLVRGEDFYTISPLLNKWWGGRQMTDMLPKLFFDHFNNTSFIAEINGEIVGFLIGFNSQSNKNEAYIHFVGVHPEKRNLKIGRILYEKFFSVVKNCGRKKVKCVTSPINNISISFHTKMGFLIEKGNKVVEGLNVHTDYDGENQDRVVFVKSLN